MTHRHRGIALILNHKYFKNMSTRQGTTKDCKDIERVLKMLGFEPVVCIDYTRKDVQAKLKQSEYESLPIPHQLNPLFFQSPRWTTQTTTVW
jgi:Caspase domain